MTGNIIGEKIEDWVENQISVRQSNQFSGYGTSPRTDDQLKYLNNKNAWVKLASSVSIKEGDVIVLNTQVNSSGETISSSPSTLGGLNTGIGGVGSIANNPINTQVLNLKSNKLRQLKIENPESYPGSKLAEKAVLFNTLSSYDSIITPLSSSRAGISNNKDLWNDSFAYGIGGTDFGIQSPPGIIGVTVDSLNRGSIRKANVTLKAHNKFQFDLIELLYLRLGFTMMLEWGWDKYLDNNGTLQPMGNTIIEEKWFVSNGITQLTMLSYIQEMRKRYDGNYDGFFGKVSNFTWNFNPDGSYDISIDLITLGDVIESLKVNTSVKEQFYPDGGLDDLVVKFKDENNPLFGTNVAKATTLNTIGYFLFTKIREISNNFTFGSLTTNENYIALASENTTSYRYPQYYIRLGEFLSQLENLIIPKIQNGDTTFSQITFDLTNNIISYFPNQIPFDPRVCIFKPSLNSYNDIKGVNIPSYLTNPTIADYITSDSTNSYGLLMNLYMNMEFIARLLVSNGDSNQELYLFKFLQDLCNGINDALGGVNKLEPIIKNDSEIVIIDQTLSIPESNGIGIEVYGYSNLTNQTSNFVKDIKFESKITPQLASMISIGATAAGTTTSEIDGTAFSKWSEDLIDRFSEKILEPNGITFEPEAESKNREKYKKMFEQFPFAGNANIQVNQRRGQSNFGAIFDLLKAYFKEGGTRDTRPRSVTKRVFDNTEYDIVGDMDFEEFFSKAFRIDKEKKEKNIYTLNELNELTSTNYTLFLLKAFGGESNEIQVEVQNFTTQQSGTGFSSYRVYSNSTTIKKFAVTSADSRYLEFDEVFISQGKSSYKSYINNLNNIRFQTENIASSEVGFIPLSFNLILDGVSGIKIYNKLQINNDFLPSNYPQSLNFIITKVNHNISNNSWDTSLSTISIPKTQPYFFTSSSGSNGTGVTGPQPDNGAPFLIVDNRNNQAIMTIDSLLSELDPIAHPAFRKFFNTLTQKYSGYKAGVNDVRRTWEESYNLKYTVGYPSQSPGNAEPGKSRHSYGLAIDINIYTPASTTKRTLLRDVKQPWIEEGIDKVATDARLIWGGNFNDVDAVHFEFVPNYVNVPYNQILAQAKAIDPTLVPPFTPSANGLAKCKKIDSLIKQGKIKLR